MSQSLRKMQPTRSLDPATPARPAALRAPSRSSRPAVSGPLHALLVRAGAQMSARAHTHERTRAILTPRPRTLVVLPSKLQGHIWTSGLSKRTVSRTREPPERPSPRESRPRELRPSASVLRRGRPNACPRARHFSPKNAILPNSHTSRAVASPCRSARAPHERLRCVCSDVHAPLLCLACLLVPVPPSAHVRSPVPLY